MIRRLSVEDIPIIREYVKDINFDCCEFNDFWKDDELYAWLSDEQDVSIAVFIDGRLAGFCLTHFAFRINKVYIENMYVEKEYRNRGLAAQMVEKLIELYKLKSCCSELRMVALVEENNSAALKSLEKCNFIIGDRMNWVQRNICYDSIKD